MFGPPLFKDAQETHLVARTRVLTPFWLLTFRPALCFSFGADTGLIESLIASELIMRPDFTSKHGIREKSVQNLAKPRNIWYNKLLIAQKPHNI